MVAVKPDTLGEYTAAFSFLLDVLVSIMEVKFYPTSETEMIEKQIFIEQDIKCPKSATKSAAITSAITKLCRWEI